LVLQGRSLLPGYGPLEIPSHPCRSEISLYTS
jgi:hypothetical protein